MPDIDETRPDPAKFDFTAFPPDTLFYDRRDGLEGRDRRATVPPPTAVEPEARKVPERRARKERRRRVDPTTFEKQYSEDEIEFMNAMQQFKIRSGKSFPSYGEVLRIAASLGYRKGFDLDEDFSSLEESPSREVEPCMPA